MTIFFFNDTATTEIYTLSLHDALPIWAIVCRAEHAKAIDKSAFPMMQGGPLLHAIAAKAVNLKECLQPAYQDYARQAVRNAQALTAGLATEGLRPVAGGTDTHLALLDLREVTDTAGETLAGNGPEARLGPP